MQQVPRKNTKERRYNPCFSNIINIQRKAIVKFIKVTILYLQLNQFFMIITGNVTVLKNPFKK